MASIAQSTALECPRIVAAAGALGFRLLQSKERTKVEVHVSDRTTERMDATIRELTPRT